VIGLKGGFGKQIFDEIFRGRNEETTYDTVAGLSRCIYNITCKNLTIRYLMSFITKFLTLCKHLASCSTLVRHQVLEARCQQFDDITPENLG
jgi:hypothetical protein